MEICEECKYWRPFQERTGECHRNAPIPYIHKPEEETLHKVTRWPLTKHTQSCGEFVQKES